MLTRWLRLPAAPICLQMVDKMRLIDAILINYILIFFVGLFMKVTRANYILPENLYNLLFNQVYDDLNICIYIF